MASMLPTLDEGFTSGSLKGSYAVWSINQGGRAETASLGVLTFDGAGGVRGSTVTNRPGSAFGQRVLVTATIQGRYVIDDDGSGYGSARVSSAPSEGGGAETTATLLITKAEATSGVPRALEFSWMEDAVDAGTGGLTMLLGVRHPDDGAFSLASFSGTYGGPGIGHGGYTPAAAIGIGAVNFHGDGNFTAVDIQNLPGTLFGERRNATFDTENGQYVVNEDGTGMIIAPGGRAPLVITRSRTENGVRICLEYYFVTVDLHPITGNLIKTTVSKRLV
ncbi:MAG TPA: hypothetical protein PK694_00425 [Rhodospirillales bacterium]|nr:hypothetical protein [Rhodospirillales bacterium]